MAHPEQRSFVSLVKDFFIDNVENLEIIEIGSYEVNGAIREIFQNCKKYIGADLAAGPGVDIICEGHKLDFPTNSFDLALSCECFEHDPFWVETFKNMMRMTKPNGLVVVTCATLGRLEHGTRRSEPAQAPGTQFAGFDYYRNLTEEDFKSNFLLDEHFSYYRFFRCPFPQDLYFIGIKKAAVKPLNNNILLFEESVQKIKFHNKKQMTLQFFIHSLHSRYPLMILQFFFPELVYQEIAIRYVRLKNSIRKIFS